MFKNYLTYNFALGFHRLCLQAGLPTGHQERLMRSAEQMLRSFSEAVRSRGPQDEGRHLFSTLINLRDCGEELALAGRLTGELASKYAILQPRLEALCEGAASRNGGQISMLG